MQKVILDTNVIVSALIQKSFPYMILNELYLNGKFELCISDELMAEYIEVLNRDKFSRFHDFLAKANAVLAFIDNNATRYTPKHKTRIIKDAEDNMLLELAYECKADFLITGNTNDFTIGKYKKTLIVTPRDYWGKHQPS